MKHTTAPWEIIRSNIDRPSGSPLNLLIDYVIESGLSEYLHCATFLINLRVDRLQNFSRNDGELIIECWKNSKLVKFSYYDSEHSQPWEKTCAPEEIISTFKHIAMNRLRWIKSGI